MVDPFPIVLTSIEIESLLYSRMDYDFFSVCSMLEIRGSHETFNGVEEAKDWVVSVYVNKRIRNHSPYDYTKALTMMLGYYYNLESAF